MIYQRLEKGDFSHTRPVYLVNQNHISFIIIIQKSRIFYLKFGRKSLFDFVSECFKTEKKILVYSNRFDLCSYAPCAISIRTSSPIDECDASELWSSSQSILGCELVDGRSLSVWMVISGVEESASTCCILQRKWCSNQWLNFTSIPDYWI